MLLTIGYTPTHDQLVSHDFRARNMVRPVLRADNPGNFVLLQSSVSHLSLSGVRWSVRRPDAGHCLAEASGS